MACPVVGATAEKQKEILTPVQLPDGDSSIAVKKAPPTSSAMNTCHTNITRATTIRST
jgi:hypothetical protein